MYLFQTVIAILFCHPVSPLRDLNIVVSKNDMCKYTSNAIRRQHINLSQTAKRHHFPKARRTSSHVFTATPPLHHSFPFQLPCGGNSDSHTLLTPIIHLSSLSSTQAQALITIQFPQSSRSVRKIHADILDSGVYLISSLRCGLRCHPYQYNTSNMKINPPYPLTHDLPLLYLSPLLTRGENVSMTLQVRVSFSFPSRITGVSNFQLIDHQLNSNLQQVSFLIPSLRTPTFPPFLPLFVKHSVSTSPF